MSRRYTIGHSALNLEVWDPQVDSRGTLVAYTYESSRGDRIRATWDDRAGGYVAIDPNGPGGARSGIHHQGAATLRVHDTSSKDGLSGLNKRIMDSF